MTSDDQIFIKKLDYEFKITKLLENLEVEPSARNKALVAKFLLEEFIL